VFTGPAHARLHYVPQKIGADFTQTLGKAEMRTNT
jgi:hypothetical protein